MVSTALETATSEETYAEKYHGSIVRLKSDKIISDDLQNMVVNAKAKEWISAWIDQS